MIMKNITLRLREDIQEKTSKGKNLLYDTSTCGGDDDNKDVYFETSWVRTKNAVYILALQQDVCME